MISKVKEKYNVTIKIRNDKRQNYQLPEQRNIMRSSIICMKVYTMIVPAAATALEVASSPIDHESRHMEVNPLLFTQLNETIYTYYPLDEPFSASQ